MGSLGHQFVRMIEDDKQTNRMVSKIMHFGGLRRGAINA